MTDRPILFSGPMVRALLDGRKTQTRRVLNPQPPEGARYSGVHFASDEQDTHFFNSPRGPFKVRRRIEEGDRLYVREAHHRTNDSPDSHLVGYDFAEGPVTREGRHHVAGVGDVQFFRDSLGGWGGRTSRNYPAMHMPRWASRLTLIVTEVRVQRIQECSELDAIAEGIGLVEDLGDGATGYPVPGLPDDYGQTPRAAFYVLWNSINEKRGFGWDANPWVVALTFTVHRQNIDRS